MKIYASQLYIYLTRFITITLCIVAGFLFVSCASSSKMIKDDDIVKGVLISTVKEDFDPGMGDVLPVTGSGGYFYFSNKEILYNAMLGTPESLKKTISLLYRSNQNYTDTEKVIIAICTGIIKQAWPESTVTWDVPDNMPETIYLDTLYSAAAGMYEPVEPNNDFFSQILPSFALFTNAPVHLFADNAELALKQALELQPNSVIAKYLLGLLYIKTNRSEEGLLFVEDVIKVVPESSMLQSFFIQALINRGRVEEAYTKALKLLEKAPSKVSYLKICADTAYLISDYENADMYVSKVLQQEPGNTEYLMLRAKILFELEEYLKVSSMLDVFARINSKTRDYLLLRAHLQIRWSKNNAAASATLEEALGFFPDDIQVLLLSAELATTTSQTISNKTALELAQKVLASEPLNERALLVVVTEYIKQKDWENGYTSSKNVLSLQTKNIKAHLLHIEICLALGHITEARQLINGLYALPNSAFTQEEHDSLHKWEIRILCLEMKKTEARKYINKYLPDASSNLKSILLYERSCLAPTDAIKLADLRASLTSNPRNADSLYALYLYYFDRLDYRKARYYLRQVIALHPTDVELLEKNTELDIRLK
ncbi:MAG TPA: hypothetical protein VFC68_05225 [Treponemataceae bacterium]|nr:hypothetical protein [Treponemataceae bacterium]